MIKIEKVGRLPVNARTLINFSENPVKIEFEYPDPDKNSIKHSDAVYGIAMIFSAFMLLILLGIYQFYIQPMIYPHATTFDTTINNITVSNYQYKNGTNYGLDSININFTWNNKFQYSKLTLAREGFFIVIPYFYQYDTRKELIILVQGLFIIGVFIVLMVFNVFWVSRVFTNTNWGHRKFPELNKKLHDAHYSAEFFPKDFPANNIIEIPLFKNMYMDYEATRDFAEQLQKISIIEHPFNKLVKKGNPFRKKGTRKGIHIIKKPNVYLWKCIVEFKDKPKDGQLTLRWT